LLRIDLLLKEPHLPCGFFYYNPRSVSVSMAMIRPTHTPQRKIIAHPNVVKNGNFITGNLLLLNLHRLAL
jgi:hypothetical protein